MNFTRIHRLLKLIGLLQSSRGQNAGRLAEECGVTRRTIFRDLEALRQSGVPLVFDDEHQRYHIPGMYFLPPTNFTPEEALAVLVLCHELGTDSRLPYYAAARSAAVKLENSLPARLRAHLRAVTGSVQIRLGAVTRLDGRQGVYQDIVKAIANRQCMRVMYDSLSDGGMISTRLSPYHLLFSRHSWYVVGRSSLHRQTRTFHLGRILRWEAIGERFRLPRGFSIDRYLRNAWHLIPEAGPDRRVAVRFKPMVARNVAEVLWHKTQRHEFRPDGSLDFFVTVSGLNEISWWILGYGDQAEVIEPPELRKLVADRAERLAAQYNGRAGSE
jgi:predicted DNA-binding transcriptional regulator YafY